MRSARLDACGADAELVALARSCLAAAPKDRPRDASGVVLGLTAYLRGVEGRLRDAELATARAEARAAGERRRRQLTLALVASVLITGLIGASGIAQSATEGNTVRLPPALMQPVVSDDVAAALAKIAVAPPLNSMVELAGPEPIRQDELVRRYLVANEDAREVVTDVHARYFGTELNDQSLTPGEDPILGTTRFGDWLSRSVPGA